MTARPDYGRRTRLRWRTGSRPRRHGWGLSAGTPQLLIALVQSIKELVPACAGQSSQGVLPQPLERGIAMGFFLRRAMPFFVKRLQESLELRAH